MHAAVAAFVVVALGLIALLLRLRIIARKPRVPDFTKTCRWARALYHNRLISIDELSRFMASHRPCPTCLTEETENADSEVR